MRGVEEDYINLNPLQTGGKTNAEVRKAVMDYVDGYSVCDNCMGALHEIKKPNFKKLLKNVSEFLGTDETLFTNGCREAKYAVMQSVCKKGDKILVDSNRHYSTDVSAQRAGLKLEFVENHGEPEYTIKPMDFKKRIEEVKPSLVVLTHVDGNYGNVVDAAKVGKICRKKSVPFLLNSAYSSGRMPIDNKKIKADFIACSCHKSWGVGGGTLGLLSINHEYSSKVFAKSKNYKNKIISVLGCSARGSSSVALLHSFQSVKKRVTNWKEEARKAGWFAKKMNELKGVNLIGDNPHEHDLMQFVTPAYYKIGQNHKDRGYFLYKFLDKKGITGLIPGRTKRFKLSTYNINKKKLEYVLKAFKEALKL